MNPNTGLYKHFKGTTYYVIGVARHTENPDETLVIYINNDDPPDNATVWARPVEMWDELVENPNGSGKVPRFLKQEWPK